MAKPQFLTILLAVTCFLGDVVSVSDREIEVCTVFYSTDALIFINTSNFIIECYMVHCAVNINLVQRRFVKFCRISLKSSMISCSNRKKRTWLVN